MVTLNRACWTFLAALNGASPVHETTAPAHRQFYVKPPFTMVTGVEVGPIIELVGLVIYIMDGVKKTWDALNDPNGQPEAFRQVAARLPLVRTILENSKPEIKKINNKDAKEGLEKVLESCEKKVQKLNKIFRKVLPGDKDGRLDRYRKALKAPFKGGRVEELMEGILKDAQLIATEKLVGIATEEQVKELAEAIKEMKEMPSSLPDETGPASPASQTHSGTGNNILNTGSGYTNNNVSGDNATVKIYASGQDQQKWSPRNMIWINPRNVNSSFTGRKELLEVMEAKLCTSIPSQTHSRKCFVITGIGGEGKSEVCLQFATTHRQKFWGVFWIDASASSTIQRGYLDAARQCQPDGSQNIEDFESSKAFFNNIKQPYLFVLDNADNIEENLDPYLPTGPSAVILITSRNYQMSDYGTAGSTKLEHLDEEDAIALLFKASHTPEADRIEKYTDAKDVVKLLAQHALAVTLAGSYIKKLSISPKQYANKFLRERESLLRYRKTQASSIYGDVYTTFEVSAQFLENSKLTNRKYADALELLGVLGYLYFTGIPEAMFTRAWEQAQTIPDKSFQPDDIGHLSPWHVSNLPKALQRFASDDGVDGLIDSLQEVFGVLRSFAIVTIHPDTKDVSMHPLAHAWARDRLNETHKQSAWACAISLIALSTESTTDCQDFLRPLNTHIEACIDASPQMPFDIYPKLEIGRAFLQFAALFSWHDNHPRCLKLTSTLHEKFGPKDSSGKTRNMIGYAHAMCLISLDEDGTAEEILVGMLHSDEASTTTPSPIILDVMTALADIYRRKGNHQLAIRIFQILLQIWKTVLHSDTSPICLTLQYKLAMALSGGGKLEEAVSLLRDVVKTQKSIMKPEDPELLKSQSILAITIMRNGGCAESICLLKDVINIQKSILKPEHPELLTSQQSLVMALSCDGKHEQAISILEDVDSIHKLIEKSGHASQFRSQYALASVLSIYGNHKAAFKIIQGLVAFAETEWDPTDKRRMDCESFLKRLSNKKNEISGIALDAGEIVGETKVDGEGEMKGQEQKDEGRENIDGNIGGNKSGRKKKRGKKRGRRKR
ncbi:hypothetical protein V495_03407 [Pseudogymnoascus sp. VKM F-4514 (FW-929)]|nr:hypothetical protein V495_03407 [Pseudogymnoascus sp. VKM F-4514 (FW-929)]KFY58906.1 hypothetical protein V497_04622 [Pseudogymnoascus sp. VKM F-4516 (FW-969)]